MIPPLEFQWDGCAMTPRRAKLADQHFVVGEHYRLVEHQERSGASHNHYFACVHQAWQNLPDDMAERFPTEDHLRRYALIKTGYRNDAEIVCTSQAEAVRAAVVAKALDPYCIAVPRNGVLTIYTAKSQSLKAMGKADFQESKDRVLAYLASLIQVEPEALAQRAREAA